MQWKLLITWFKIVNLISISIILNLNNGRYMELPVRLLWHIPPGVQYSSGCDFVIKSQIPVNLFFVKPRFVLPGAGVFYTT